VAHIIFAVPFYLHLPAFTQSSRPYVTGLSTEYSVVESVRRYFSFLLQWLTWVTVYHWTEQAIIDVAFQPLSKWCKRLHTCTIPGHIPYHPVTSGQSKLDLHNAPEL